MTVGGPWPVPASMPSFERDAVPETEKLGNEPAPRARALEDPPEAIAPIGAACRRATGPRSAVLRRRLHAAERKENTARRDAIAKAPTCRPRHARPGRAPLGGLWSPSGRVRRLLLWLPNWRAVGVLPRTASRARRCRRRSSGQGRP